MNVNVSEFKSVLGKATLNNSIETVQLRFSKEGKVTSKLISANKDAISILNTNNNVLDGVKEEIELNFRDPNKDLLPFLNLLTNDSVKINIKDEKIIISDGKQKLDLHFCAPQIVSVFDGEIEDIPDPFNVIEADENFMDSFKKINKVGSKFGFVYFSINKNKFYIETTDKGNKFSNGVRMELGDVKYENVDLCFNFKNLSNLVAIINDEFSLSFYYMKDHGAGMMKAENEDGSEIYYIMSIISGEQE